MKIVLIFFLLIDVAWALSPIRNYRKGRVEVHWETNYSKTQHNFDDSGSMFERLPGDNYFSNITSTLEGRWVFARDLGFFGSMGMGMSEAFDGLTVNRRTSLTEMNIGADYRLYSSWFRLIPEVTFTYPFTRVDTDQTAPLTSEGAKALQGRMIINTKWGLSFQYLYAGLKYRSDGRAWLVPWGFGTRLKFTDFAVSLGMNGYVTGYPDAHSDDPAARNAVTDRADAGSRYFYAVDPARLEYGGSLSFYLTSRFFVTFAYSDILMGQNTAYGPAYTVLFSYVYHPPRTDNFRVDDEVRRAKEEMQEQKQKIPRQLETFDEDREADEEDNM